MACDVLMVNRDVLDRAAQRIERATGIPFDHILINATHTHHAPTTATIHGYTREEGFTRQVEEKIVRAVTHGERPPGRSHVPVPAGRRVFRGKEQPAAAAMMARSTGWAATTTPCGRPGRSIPSCPFWASAEATASSKPFCSTIPRTRSAPTSPAFARRHFMGWPLKLEKDRGGTVIFFEGASGSTHNLDVPIPEATHRIEDAVLRALGSCRAAGRSIAFGP